jgi:membrane associated rhomboid family serine protease
MATFTYRSSSYLFMVFRFSYSTGWGVFCKSKEKTTKECRICCWALLKLHTVGWRHILPNMYAFVSLKKFFFHIFGDVKYVHDQYCQFTDSRGSLMVLGHWYYWVTDGLGPLMVLDHWCYWVTDGLWFRILEAREADRRSPVLCQASEWEEGWGRG